MDAASRFAGIIRITPHPAASFPSGRGDATLDELFGELANCYHSPDGHDSAATHNRIFHHRVCWPPTRAVEVALAADLTQLSDELQAQFDRLDQF